MEFKESRWVFISVVLYEVAVFTSDKSGADTSANPYIVLYGDEIRTPQVDLCKNKAERKGKFKRGACDRFVLEVSLYFFFVLKHQIRNVSSNDLILSSNSARRCWQNKKDSRRS